MSKEKSDIESIEKPVKKKLGFWSLLAKKFLTSGESEAENPDTVAIGDLTLQSTKKSVIQLGNIADKLLKKRSVINYLELKKSRNIPVGRMFG